MSSIRKKTIKGLKAGDTFSVSRQFSELDVSLFADISQDYNPVHFDERFTRTKNFHGRVCHGLLVASLITEIGGQIGWLASGMSFKFKKPVYFNHTVRCDFTITEINNRGRAKAEALFFNDDGDIIIEATLTGNLPGNEEKQVMQAMLDEGDPTNKISRPKP